MKFNKKESDILDMINISDTYKLLNPFDLIIVSLKLNGYTLQEIADKLNFKSHSVVLRRLQKIKPIFKAQFSA